MSQNSVCPSLLRALALTLGLFTPVCFAADLKGVVQQSVAAPNPVKPVLTQGTIQQNFSSQAAALNGRVNATAGRTLEGSEASNGRPMLQGGVKNSATLEPSLRMIPGTAASQRPLSGVINGARAGAGVTDYSGRAPQITSVSQPPAARGIGGVIPPLSSYSMTPRTVTTYGVPGCTTVHDVTTVTVQSSVPSGSISGGVWTRSGYESTITSLETWKSQPYGSGSGGGVAGGGTRGVIWARDRYVSVVSSGASYSGPGGITNWAPGSAVCLTSNSKGINAVPGYEVSIVSGGLNKQTIGGHWSAPSTTAIGQRIPSDKIQVEPLSAARYLLPALGVRLSPVANIDDWHAQVAKAIYSRWQNSEVGAGKARIQIVVKDDRHLAGQVIDFFPVQDGERNVDAETRFRETALHCVNDVNIFEVPPFPSGVSGKELAFDVELSRVVDGPSGITMASAKPLVDRSPLAVPLEVAKSAEPRQENAGEN